MRRRRSPLTAMLIAAATALAACGGGGGATADDEPATAEPIPGTDLKRLTLTPRAEQRLDIRTATVSGRPGGGQASGARPATKAIPYSAVMYGTDGATFAYTTPRPHVYVRAPIRVVRIAGDLALLAGGPPIGTRVVSVGAAELYGEELGVGH
jgi:hypothetical protein